MRAPVMMMRIALAAGAIGACACLAIADKVVLKSGQEYTGEVVEQSGGEVKFRTKVGPIVTVLTLRRHEIKRIETGPLPDGFWPSKDDAPSAGGDDDGAEAEAPGAPAAASSSAEQYLRIPIEGAIGGEVFAKGVDRALKHAQRKRIARVVFDIDTPGGSVGEATDIANAITAHRQAMAERGIEPEIIAFVRHAISAGIWIAFSCDRIFIVDGGSIGGAVAYTRDHSTGDAEVDAKMNSILAADVASLAESNGYPAPVVKAMMIMAEECWAWPAGSGEVHISSEKPRDDDAARKAWKVDGSSTVLTLKSDEAVRLGIAEVVRGGVDALGPAMGLTAWSSAGPAGEQAMKWGADQGARERAKAEANFEELVKVVEEIKLINDVLLPRAYEVAIAAHPLNGRYMINRESGQFSGESRLEWMRRTDEALDAWEDVQNGLKKLDKLDRRHKDLSGQAYFNRTHGRFVAKDLERIISDLKRNRDRTSPP